MVYVGYKKTLQFMFFFYDMLLTFLIHFMYAIYNYDYERLLIYSYLYMLLKEDCEWY